MVIVTFRIQQKLYSVAKKVSAVAMEMTQVVVNAQNIERRKFVEQVKLGMGGRLQVKREWQQLIQQLTHER